MQNIWLQCLTKSFNGWRTTITRYKKRARAPLLENSLQLVPTKTRLWKLVTAPKSIGWPKSGTKWCPHMVFYCSPWLEFQCKVYQKIWTKCHLKGFSLTVSQGGIEGKTVAGVVNSPISFSLTLNGWEGDQLQLGWISNGVYVVPKDEARESPDCGDLPGDCDPERWHRLRGRQPYL